MNVVQHMPAIMIGVFVHDEIVAIAVPAPARSDIPVPRGDLKRKAAGKPENMTVTIKSLDAIPIRRAEVFEMPVFKWMIHVIPLVVRFVVTIPMIVVHVGQAVDAPAFAAILLGGGRAGVAARGRVGDVPLVGARRIWAVLLMLLFALLLVRAPILGSLCEGWEGQQ
jgi:hypothetical protein